MSFSDPFTPMQPTLEIPRPSPEVGVYTVIGSASVTITSAPKSLATLIDELNPGQGYTYGQATGLLIQANVDSYDSQWLNVYYWLGAIGFRYDDPTRGPNANQGPFVIARNRYQIEHLELQASNDSLVVGLQFFTGNPNVSP